LAGPSSPSHPTSATWSASRRLAAGERLGDSGWKVVDAQRAAGDRRRVGVAGRAPPLGVTAAGRENHHRGVAERGYGEAGRGARRPVHVQRVAQPLARGREEPGPGMVGEQRVGPVDRVGHVFDVPGRPGAAQRDPPGAQPPLAQRDLALRQGDHRDAADRQAGQHTRGDLVEVVHRAGGVADDDALPEVVDHLGQRRQTGCGRVSPTGRRWMGPRGDLAPARLPSGEVSGIHVPSA
jgi:hypothetical protein